MTRSTWPRSLVLLLSLLLAGATIAVAGDDPSIQGETRSGVQHAMTHHIDTHTVGDVYPVYDAVDGVMRHLTLAKLHSGIVKKGEFYVSCADFVDGDGNRFDLDFLVLEDDGSFKTVETIVHKVDGTKRPYDLGS